MLRRYCYLFFFICLILSSGTLSAQLIRGGADDSNYQIANRTRITTIQRQEAAENNLAYSESIFLTSNYSGITSFSPENMSLKELLSNDVEGFYFYLRNDSGNEEILVRNPDRGYSSFLEALHQIKEALDGEDTKIITLFLDFQIEFDIDSLFRESGLFDYLYTYDRRNDWPLLKTMIHANERLVVFEMQKHINSPMWLHNFADYITGLPDTFFENIRLGQESFDGKLAKSLFVFTGFQNVSIPETAEDDVLPYTRQSPYLIEAYKRAWMNIGKVPNFILFDKYESWLGRLALTVRGFHLVQGAITYNNELLNYVNWQGLSNYTSGKFNFPLESSGQLLLLPTSPGYEIAPRAVRVTNPTKKYFVNDFKARPLRIEDGLELLLTLDNNVRDFSYNRNKISANDIELTMDPIRGSVASLSEESYIILPTAERLNIRDHDFTVSAWIKIPQFIPEKDDYAVLANRGGGYQHGLHFLIRSKRPYMGFFNNDLAGKTILEAGKWHHVTWRYNKTNGEQAIFVDGKLDVISANRPAYQGSDSLFVGLYSAQGSGFVGLIDNLCIWSRVLSDKEIMLISNQMVEFKLSTWNRLVSNTPLFISLLSITILLITGALLYYILKLRKHKSNNNEELNKVFRETPDKNCIRLFGEFYVTDNEGGNITALFTPKLKQLFLLIMLYSQQDQSGISSTELTKIIWGEEANTKSIRSVSILKLRKILEKINKIELAFNTNKYAMIFSDEVYCDYLVCLNMLKNNKIKSKKEFERFFEIISNGEIFKEESFDWLDDFKGDICNSIVDVITHFIGEYSLTDETETIILLANQILLNDPSNEDALIYKVKALIHQNNSKSAKHTYNKFCTLYQEMYGEKFNKSFEEVVSSSIN